MRKATLFKMKPGEKHKYAVRISKENGRTFTVKFGQNGAPDYTTHKDPDRRLDYLSRHGREKPSMSKSRSEKWGQDGIFTAGYWSRWLLWEKPSLRDAINFMRLRKNIDIKYSKTKLT